MAAKPTLLVTRRVPDRVTARLLRDFDARLNESDRIYGPEELLQRSEGADGILCCVTEPMTADIVARLPESVRVVASYSVGVDHCDLEAAAQRGLIITNTPEVLNDATAEVAMLLLLGAARRAGEGERMMRTASWKEWNLSFMVGTEVTGKRLGIVGMGRIGQIVARRARGFDMKIHYYNRSRLPDALEGGATYHATVEELLPHCDFLSVNCPATAETAGLINRERLSLLPRGAILVNTARGAVVEDEAVIEALRSGQLAAAGLDVYNNEPDVHPDYRALLNTFLLPHVGSATRETRDAMGFCALDNLDAVFAGREPPNRVV